MTLAAIRRSFGPFDWGLRVVLALLITSSIVALGLAPGEAAAQGLEFGSSDSDKPIEIYADEGIEWHQKQNAYVARGNARAVRGKFSVHADTLSARYRKADKGKTEIWRIEADGHVRLRSPTETAYADKAVYDIDNGVLVLTGKDLKLVTAKQKITARDSLEYWEKKQMSVARGEALVVEEDRRLKADILTAHFRKAKDEATELYLMEAFGNVRLSTPSDVARGERGVYNVETGIATLTGSVKITRGKNQLNGDVAEVNLKTGVSRILSASKTRGAAGPVRALIMPQESPDKPSVKSKKSGKIEE